MKTGPLISIITPSYNQGQFLEQTIKSVIDQDYENKEHIIIDGGSSDNSVDIIHQYEKHLAHWISEPDNGQVNAICKGFDMAKGDVLCWLNSDDYFLPHALRRVADAINSSPDAVAWVGGCRLIDPSGIKLRTVAARKLSRADMADWGNSGWFFQPSCFFSADAYHRVGGLSDRFKLAFDVELWIKLAELGEFIKIDEVLSAAIIHDDAKTQKQKNEMKAEHIMIQAVYGFDDIAKERIGDILKQAWFFHDSRVGRLIYRLFRGRGWF